jgi:phosphatidylinositol phosphate synthase
VRTLGTDVSRPPALWAPPSESKSQAPSARLSQTVWERSLVAGLLYRGMFGLGRWLGRIGVTANVLTYLSLVVAAIGGGLAALGIFGWAALMIILGGVCDALDGIVARTTGTVTRYGALLDSSIDRVTDALPLVGILVFYGAEPELAPIPAVALLAAIVIPYVRARAESLGVDMPPLYWRRPERLVATVVCLLLGTVPLELGVPAPLLLGGVVLLSILNVVAALSALSAARRALIAAPPNTPADASPNASPEPRS